jgi:hypothetical protein
LLLLFVYPQSWKFDLFRFSSIFLYYVYTYFILCLIIYIRCCQSTFLIINLIWCCLYGVKKFHKAVIYMYICRCVWASKVLIYIIYACQQTYHFPKTCQKVHMLRVKVDSIIISIEFWHRYSSNSMQCCLWAVCVLYDCC